MMIILAHILLYMFLSPLVIILLFGLWLHNRAVILLWLVLSLLIGCITATM